MQRTTTCNRRYVATMWRERFSSSLTICNRSTEQLAGFVRDGHTRIPCTGTVCAIISVIIGIYIFIRTWFDSLCVSLKRHEEATNGLRSTTASRIISRGHRSTTWHDIWGALSWSLTLYDLVYKSKVRESSWISELAPHWCQRFIKWNRKKEKQSSLSLQKNIYTHPRDWGFRIS